MVATIPSTGSDLGILDFSLSYLGRWSVPIENYPYEQPRPVFIINLFSSSSISTVMRDRQNQEVIVSRFIKTIADASKDLDPKAYEFINANYWDLI